MYRRKRDNIYIYIYFLFKSGEQLKDYMQNEILTKSHAGPHQKSLQLKFLK